MDFATFKLLKPKPRFMQSACSNSFKILSDEREAPPQRVAFERKEDFRAALFLHVLKGF